MRRLVLAALAALPVLSAPVVARAVPVSCFQLADATDDAVGLAGGVSAPRSDSDLDIEKAGIATTAKDIGIWLKLYAFDPVDTSAPTGRRFDLSFTVRGMTKTVSVAIDHVGSVYASDGVTPKTDFTGFQLHVTVPLAKLGLTGLRTGVPRLHRAGDAVTALSVTTWRWEGRDLAGGMTYGDPADTAAATFRYEHRAPSCIKPGQ
jgi:hypothetical protein